jgi:hypothetical protein
MSTSFCQKTNKNKGVYIVTKRLFTERNVLKHEWEDTVSKWFMSELITSL